MKSLDSQIAEVANGAVRRQLGRQVHASIQRGDYESAVRICDALILYPHNDLSVLCNALWVIQPDNTGQPLDERMAKRFLAASIFRAGFNPAMHINAAAVYAHFDDAGRVLRHLFLAKQHQQDLSSFLDDSLFDHVRTDPRWAELLGTHEPVDEPTWIEVALEACEAGEYANAFPALWWFWSKTRSSRIAELIELVSERAGSRIGYQGEVLEAALRDAPETLSAAFNESVRRGTRSDASGIVPSAAAGEEDLSESLVWLADDAADPRFASAMLRILGSVQLPAKKTVQDGLRSLLDNLEALRDKRIAPGLAELSRDLLEAPTPIESWLALELAHLSGVLAAMPEPELTPTEKRGCERLEALLGPRTRDIGYVRPESRAPATPVKDVDPLLAVWRKTRSAEVADVLDLQRMRHPEVPELGQAIKDAWIPGDGSEREVGATAAAQLIWDAKHRDDPRLASTFIRLFDDPPFLLPMREGNGVEEFWREVIAACDSLQDPRLVAALRGFSSRVLSLTREADGEARRDMYLAFPLGPFLKAQLDKCADGIEASPNTPLDEDQRELLEAARAEYAAEKEAHAQALLRGVDRGATEDSLLADIVREPGNDAARLAYADFLGDTPRGRFIRLQIARASGGEEDLEAEAALQMEHQFQWVEPFSHLLQNLVFERGFLTRCTLRIDPYGDPMPDECVGHPLWTTVHTVRSNTDAWRIYDQELLDTVPSNSIEAFAHPALGSLRQLDGVSAEGLIELVARGCTEYELVTLEPNEVDEESWPKVAEALCALPSLRVLRLRFSGRVGLEGLLPLLDVSEELRHLALEIDAQGLQRARLSLSLSEELFDSAFEQITYVWSANNFDLGIERDELHFTRANDGWGVAATQRAGTEAGEPGSSSHEPTQFWLSPFITQLKQLPMDALTSFRLCESGAAPSQVSLDALSKALEAFPRLESVALLAAGDSPEEIQRLITALEDPGRAERACRVLGSFKAPAARDALARHAAHNETLSVRYAAIEALAELADESVVPTLCDALDTTAAGAKGAELLGYLRARSAIPALIDYAPNVEASDARNEIAEVFTRIDSPEAIPVLLENYAKDPSAQTLIALARLGAPEARELTLSALQSGGDGAIVALAFVGEPEDVKLLEGFFDSRLGVTHIRGIPLLASLALMPDASPSHIEKMASAIEKSWSSGVSEDCAWLMLELRARLGTPGAKWSNFAAQVLEWCESCIAWSYRARAESSYGLDARKWMYWEDLLHEVVSAWRSPLPNHSARAGAR